MPRVYSTVFDPLETLTYVAAITKRIQLGTSAILALFHPPVVLARRLATLDQLSGGRLIAGLAIGWLEEEFVTCGIPMAHRGRRMTAFVAALRAAWGDNPVSFQSEFYSIPESDIGPKPAQAGGIPILLAYQSDGALKRAARIGDGLNPFAAMRHERLDRLERDIALFRKTAQEAGRDGHSLPVVVRANAQLTDKPLDRQARPLFVGTVETWLEDLRRISNIGVTHVIFGSDTPAPLHVQLEVLAEIRQRIQ
jgi:probable F420-dependent oxidoreductase